METLKLGGKFIVTCTDKHGDFKWKDECDNLVTNQGLQHILDALFAGATQLDPWETALLTGTPSPAAGDTMGDITELVSYSEATRQEYTDVRSGQSVTNSAAKATFTLNGGDTTIGGAALVSGDTKSSTAGTLLAYAAFSGGDKTGDSLDSVEVTYTFTAADA